MNLQRYEAGVFFDGTDHLPAMMFDTDGEYVKHTDALDAVSAARADALRWVLVAMEANVPLYTQFSNVGRERARLRAIIEKELEK